MKTVRVLPSLVLIILLALTALARTPESFLERVSRFLGVSATPSKQKGPGDEVKSGNIWIANLELQTRVPVTSGGGFRSPVFLSDNQTLIAIKENKIVKVSIGDDSIVQELFTVDGLIKLVGLSKSETGEVLILRDIDQDNCPSVGILSLQDGSVVSLPYQTEDDKRMLSHLQSWNREYDNEETKFDIRIQRKTQGNRQVESSDVFLKTKNKDWINVSKCEAGVNCSHPSISGDRALVTFVKAG